MNDVGSPNERFTLPSLPVNSATRSHRQGNFTISTRKLPISRAGPIDALSNHIGIPIPEMIFGDNLVSITHAPTGWSIEFNAADALDAVDKTGANMLQVAYAKDWSSSRGDVVRDVVKPFDWSYSTVYRGTVRPPPPGCDSASAGEFKPVDAEIPLDLLRRRDPILYFDDVVLYESELDDNGISLLSVKVRVHEARMLLLCRLFMRLDGVLVRVRDTRIYVDFETDQVLREYTCREENFGKVKKALYVSGRLPDDVTIALRDANMLAPLLPVVDRLIEGLNLASVS